MRLFNKLQNFPHSFYSQKLYQNAAKLWGGLGFSYLCILAAFIVIIFSLYAVTLAERKIFTQEMHELSQVKAMEVIEQLPALQWKKATGVQLLNEEKNGTVIHLYLDGEASPIALIDTEMGVEEWGGVPPILINSTGVYAKSDRETKSRNWADMGLEEGQVLDRTLAIAVFDKSSEWIWENRFIFYVVFFFLALIYLCLLHMVQALIFGGLGLIMKLGFKVKLEYDAMVRIAAIALTPAILIDWLLFGVTGAGMNVLIFSLLTLVYIGYALSSLSKQETLHEESE
ncbi:MAG: DUF1189 family protein [Rickettsiales bacterium]|nr:DUF1189 family protein [Rickettsiales bacterium]